MVVSKLHLHSAMAPDSSSTSISLIRRVKKHDATAWSRFVRLYTPLVYRWARRMDLQHADAGDVVQEVFGAVSRDVGRYDPAKGSGFRGWLWGITRHKLLQRRRVEASTPKAHGGPTADAIFRSVPDHPPEELSESMCDLAQRAARLIESDFRPRTWQAFWRVCIEGQDPTRVAEDLEMTPGAIYTAKSRVLAHLRRELEGELPF